MKKRKFNDGGITPFNPFGAESCGINAPAIPNSPSMGKNTGVKMPGMPEGAVYTPSGRGVDNMTVGEDFGKKMPEVVSPRDSAQTRAMMEKQANAASNMAKVPPMSPQDTFAQNRARMAERVLAAANRLKPGVGRDALMRTVDRLKSQPVGAARPADKPLPGQKSIEDFPEMSIAHSPSRFGGAGRDIGMKKGGNVKAYAKGGSVSSASSRGDGIAKKGKTKGRIY